MKYLLKAVAKLIRLLSFGQLKYSRQVEGSALYMDLSEKLWWGYKFYGSPIQEPQRGKKIREHFQENPPIGFNEKALENIKPEELPSIRIALGGDILPCADLSEQLPEHLGDVLAFFQSGDIRCANLESPVLPTRPICMPPEDITAPPNMNNSPETVAFLLGNEDARQGITVFSTANNHSMDQGIEGVLATLDVLDELGAYHVGSARSVEERDGLLIVEAKGFKIAFLSWTFSLNSHSLPQDQEYLVNTLRINLPGIDLSPITSQVAQAKRRGADAVVLCLHWGLEDESFPLASQIETAHRLAQSGIDIICGNHPHALQPAERYVWKDEDGDGWQQRESLIAYAFGDLLTPQPHLGLSRLSAIMELSLLRLPDGRVVIFDVSRKELLALEDKKGRRKQ